VPQKSKANMTQSILILFCRVQKKEKKAFLFTSKTMIL
jgi:hypothetical protein